MENIGPCDHSLTLPELQYQKKIVSLSDEIVEIVRENRGIINRLFHRAWSFFITGPRREIYHDWLFAFSFYYKTIKVFCARGEQNVSTEDESILVTVLSYLRLAKVEMDYAHAWSYINLAITHLTMIVEEKDLNAFTFYLKSRNIQVNYLPKDNKVQLFLKRLISPFHRKAIYIDRNRIHSLLLNAAYRWNEINCQTSFKLSLLKSVGSWLFFGLMVAIIIAEYITSSFGIDQPINYPYTMISLLGFFGGGLSAFLTARQAVINLNNSALIRILTSLRMILGGAGSFVVYVTLQCQPLEEIPKALSQNPAFFITIGIVAGFSERLFINSLKRISGNMEENRIENEK